MTFPASPLRRLVRLLRHTPLRPKKRLAPVNPARLAKLKAKQYGPAGYRAWLLAHRCVTCREAASDMAHVISRGAGGTWRETIPMCHRCHDLQHRKGWKALAARTGWDYAVLLAQAREYASQYSREHPLAVAQWNEEMGRA